MSQFRIIERLDKGGMAEVFRGISESMKGFKKSVVIKRILPSLAKNQKFVAMFLDEARLSLSLQHANIVHVFDIGKSDNTFFLVMEYVDGCNLRAVMDYFANQRRRIPIPEALYIMTECCKGLAYAHQLDNPETGEPLGIVHRDISPPNLLLSKNGEVKLVDFGLAKANTQLEETDQGVVKGKFSYLSPEAAQGAEVDHRADIFAVGIILWEMFTGSRLFYGDTDFATVEAVREAHVPSIAAVNPWVEPELEAVVRKALAREPADRYQDAADLGDALTHYLFSRGMKVGARNVAGLVTDVREARVRDSGATPSLVDAVIQQEMDNVMSLLDEPSAARPTAEQPRPQRAEADLIDTSNWATELGLDDDDVPHFLAEPEPPAPAPRDPHRPPPIPPRRKKR